MWTRRIGLLAALVATMLIPSLAWSQAKVATTGYQFLEIGVGARAIGMGEAFIASVDDASAIYYNPAGLTALPGTQITFDYLRYVADIDYGFAGMAFPAGSIGGYFGIGLYAAPEAEILIASERSAFPSEEIVGQAGTSQDFRRSHAEIC